MRRCVPLMSVPSLSDLVAWLRRRQPVREPPPFSLEALERLPPELRRMIDMKTGVRPLLQFAQASRATRAHIDGIFVHIFNRDVWAYVDWPTATESQREYKAAIGEVIRENFWNDPTPLHLVYSGLQYPVPHYFYRLYFLGAEQAAPAGQARLQKLRLADLYKRACKKLAKGFVAELEFAYKRALEQGQSLAIRWVDCEVPSQSFSGTFLVPLQQWSWDQGVLTFGSIGATPSSMQPHLTALTRLAPSIGRVGRADVKKVWTNAFMDLLLDVGMRFESVIRLDANFHRRLGLQTMVNPFVEKIPISS
jgi:hypothetical protein